MVITFNVIDEKEVLQIIIMALKYWWHHSVVRHVNPKETIIFSNINISKDFDSIKWDNIGDQIIHIEQMPNQINLFMANTVSMEYLLEIIVLRIDHLIMRNQHFDYLKCGF
jgi:hypothetical protein